MFVKGAGGMPAVPMQTFKQCRPLHLAGHGVRSRSATLPWRASGQHMSSRRAINIPRKKACEARRRAIPAVCGLSMGSRSSAMSETGLGHVFVSLFPGECTTDVYSAVVEAALMCSKWQHCK